MRSVYLYGVGGGIDAYRVIRYTRIDEDCISIMTLKYEAMSLRMECPSIKRVFAVDNSGGVARAYMDAKRRPLVEENVAFIDLLEKQGIEIDLKR